MNVSHSSKLGLAALLALVCSASHSQTALAPAAAAQELDVQGGKVRVVTVASGLSHPWSLAFLPDGKSFLVAEAGRIRIVRDGVLAPDAVYTVPAGTSK